MFCLRSWLPLLFIPTNASPIFILIFFTCTYFLNRPCVYCSFLLIILFASSCQWSEHCFFDFTADWFVPPSAHSSMGTPTRLHAADPTSTASGGNNVKAGAIDEAVQTALVYAQAMNSTATTLGGLAINAITRKLLPGRAEWTGIGMGWLRSLLGKREWRIPCIDVNLRL